MAIRKSLTDEQKVKKVGVKEVADEAGVVVSTVSHVLNGTASISPEVRERVLDAARRLGYLAKRKAKGTIASLNTIFLAVPASSMPHNDVNLFSWTILTALSRECERRGIRIVPCSIDRETSCEQIIEGAREVRADGIILFHEDNPGLLRVLKDSGITTVLLNGEDPTMSVDTTVPANRNGARLATENLLAKGHRRIMHLTWHGRDTIRRRFDGFVDAYTAWDLPLEESVLCIAQGYEPDHGAKALEDWLSENGGLNGVTAIFAAADNLAVGALRTLQAAGLDVPEDVALVGFDGVALGDLTVPPLSTVRVPLDYLAINALDMLESRLSGDTGMPPRRVELACQLVERVSGGERLARAEIRFKK